MNVLDASLKLYGWFGKNDSFSIEDDFLSLILITDDREKDMAAVFCALDSLEKYEVIQSKVIETEKLKDKKIWTLLRPLDSMTQNIEIPYDLASLMASVINDFSDAIDRKESYCDPSEVKSDNIKDLVFIASFYMDTHAKADDANKDA